MRKQKGFSFGLSQYASERTKQAPPWRGYAVAATIQTKNGFPLGGSCRRRWLMRGERGVVYPLIHRKRAPFPRRGKAKEKLKAFSRRGKVKENLQALFMIKKRKNILAWRQTIYLFGKIGYTINSFGKVNQSIRTTAIDKSPNI